MNFEEKFQFPLPTLEEIRIARRLAASNPDDLDEREAWILNKFCRGDSYE